MSNRTEPHNPFYLLLLLASLLFVFTALAYGVLPVLEEKSALASGVAPPSSLFREALSNHGWLWLIGELVAIVILSLLSMGLDRLRSLQNAPSPGTMPPASSEETSPPAS